MKRLMKRLLILTISTVVGLLICEGVLRVFNYPPPQTRPPRYRNKDMNPIVPERDKALFSRHSDNPFIRYELKPNTVAYICFDHPWMDYFDEHGRVRMEINSHGMRDVEYAKVPPPSTHRILCLGDSFTFGHGVPLRHSYPKQMERVLNRKYADSRFEVLNGGFGAGPEICNYVAFLIVKGTAMKPRTVILTLCLNDVGDVPMDIRQDARISLPGRKQFRVLQLLAGGIESVRERWMSDPDDCFRRHYPSGKVTYWKESVITAKNWCKLHEMNLLVVVYPMMVSLNDRYPWVRFHEVIADLCRENGIEILDLFAAFKGRDARSLWAHVSDQHPNPEGHAIAAGAIIEWLEKRGWIP